MAQPNSLYEYIKYSFKAAPIFLAIVVFADFIINERSLKQITAQHQRDIALNINNASFVLDTIFADVDDRFEAKERVYDILKSFSKLPGVGCVSFSAEGIKVTYPPEAFCANITISDTITSTLASGGILKFHLDDKYLREIKATATETLVYASALILFAFMVFNFLAFKFVFEKQLQNVLWRNRKLFAESPVAQVEISEDGKILQASIGWIEVFGSFYGNLIDYVAGHAKKGLVSYINEVASGSSVDGRQNFPFIDEQNRKFSGSVEAYLIDNNKRPRIILAVHNVEDMEITIAEKERESRLDVLTSISSRRAFEQDAKNLLLERDIFLGLFDIDNFKSVNDLYGYSVGDQVIVKTAQYLLQNTPDGASVYRFGGEEFICVVPKAAAQNFDWKRLIEEFSEVVFESGLESFSRSLSGCIIDVAPFLSLSDGLKACEALVSKAKASGGNTVLFNDDGVSVLVDAHSATSILHGLNENQFYFEFQTVYDTLNSKAVGCEALIRWKLDDRILYPSSFIRSYYKATFSKELSKLRHLQLAKHLSLTSLNEKLYVSYNIGIEDIIAGRHSVLVDVLKPFLVRHLIVLELSEDEFDRRMSMSDMTEVLQELSGHGFKIALDDFGKKSSNFNRFIQIPIDILKVDLELVRSIDVSAKRQAVMRALVNVCSEFDVALVAEGVETEAEMNALKNIGVHLHQGFLYNSMATNHLSF